MLLTNPPSVINLINPAIEWDRQKLLSDPNWIYHFTSEDINELEHAFDNFLCVKKENQLSDSENLRINFKLNKLQDKLNFASHFLENSKGIFLLKNYPIKSNLSDTILMFQGLGHCLGTPLNQNREGDKVLTISTSGSHGYGQNTSRATSVNDALQFHSDRCDVAALLCCKKAKKGGVNYIVSSIALHNKILETFPQYLETLYSPYCYSRASWENNRETDYYSLPVFSYYQGFFASRYLRGLIDDAQQNPAVPRLTIEQKSALHLLEEMANDPSFHLKVTLEPGDILLLNNFITLHARSLYEDFEEIEKKRLLLRLWLSVPNSRPLHPVLKPLFGSVAAGELRGGIS